MANFRLPGPIGLHLNPFQTFSTSTADTLESRDRGRTSSSKSASTLGDTEHRAISSNFYLHSYVTVFVWVSHVGSTSPGHAALALRPNAQTPQAGYVSFAPLEQGTISGPGHFYTKDHDIEHYGSISLSSKERRGVWIANLYGLNIALMIQRLERDLLDAPQYSIANECATTVHRYLQIGGGDQFASWWSSHVMGFWSPDDVEDYARSIADNTKTLGSNYQKYSGVGTVWG